MIEHGLAPRVLLTGRVAKNQLSPAPVFGHDIVNGDTESAITFPTPCDELTWRRQERAFLATCNAQPGVHLLHGGERIESAQDVDSAKALRADIETAKATLGSALFTELKNKAVKRYYLVDARNKVEAAINSLPQPDEPNAAERFAEAERVLASSKRHLGDELHDQFSITLADMKPEYVD